MNEYLATGQDGVRTASATLSFISDGTGVDSLGTTALGSQAIGLIGTLTITPPRACRRRRSIWVFAMSAMLPSGVRPWGWTEWVI